jgi:nucleotidyltransferase substrate binding protein (TIGR01987 family)
MSAKFGALLRQFARALDRLKEALRAPATDMARDSAIQRFEFTFDLSWKCLKQYLEESDPSLTLRFPREAFREAFRKRIIKDSPLWFETIENRNLTSHTYNESAALVVYEKLPSFIALYDALLDVLKKG